MTLKSVYDIICMGGLISLMAEHAETSLLNVNRVKATISLRTRLNASSSRRWNECSGYFSNYPMIP